MGKVRLQRGAETRDIVESWRTSGLEFECVRALLLDFSVSVSISSCLSNWKVL